MATTKMIVFDMDGTIANLYGVNNWLKKLRAECPSPYAEAAPMYDMEELVDLLNKLRAENWKIAVTSWLSKNSSTAYKKAVRQAKLEWLERYNFPADEVHLVAYGTTKANCTRHKADFQILVDDNKKVRAGWNLGATIDAKKNIMIELRALLEL